MLYITFFIILLFFLQINNKKDSKLLFNLFFFLLIALLCIRYGQGTDYFNYKRIYSVIPNDYDSFWVKCFLYGIEPFYYLINVFAKKTGFGFPFVVASSALIMGFFHYKTITGYSKARLLSFFILFANYFAYMHNLIRQGIAMSITTYAILYFLDKRNLKKYILMCIFAMMFHTSAFICLFVPVFLKVGKIMKVDRLSHYVLLAFISLVSGLFLFRLMIFVASMILPRYTSYQNSAYLLGALFPISIRFFFAVLVLTVKEKYDMGGGRI